MYSSFGVTPTGVQVVPMWLRLQGAVPCRRAARSLAMLWLAPSLAGWLRLSGFRLARLRGFWISAIQAFHLIWLDLDLDSGLNSIWFNFGLMFDLDSV